MQLFSRNNCVRLFPVTLLSFPFQLRLHPFYGYNLCVDVHIDFVLKAPPISLDVMNDEQRGPSPIQTSVKSVEKLTRETFSLHKCNWRRVSRFGAANVNLSVIEEKHGGPTLYLAFLISSCGTFPSGYRFSLYKRIPLIIPCYTSLSARLAQTSAIFPCFFLHSRSWIEEFIQSISS